LKKDFYDRIKSFKKSIKKDLDRDKFTEAYAKLSKLKKSSGYSYFSESRNIELSDVCNWSWGNSISKNIEEKINLSSWFDKVSSDQEIRVAASQVLKKYKNRLEEYFKG
jgi:aconitase A